MTKHILYTYLGTNGTITSMVHLENVYCTRQVELIADQGMRLTKNNKDFTKAVRVPEDEVDQWKEVPGQI